MEAMFFLIFALVLTYVILVMPVQRQRRRQREMLSALQVGDEVVTSGGIIGKVRALDGDEVSLELARGTRVRVLRAYIVERRQAAPPPAEAPSPDDAP